MKRKWCLILAFVLLLTLCSACGAAQPETSPEEELPADDLRPLPPSVPVVIPIGERSGDTVTVTLHGGLVGDFAEELTERQISEGFLTATRNEDDSVTYTIAADKYDAMVERYRKEAREAILYTVEDGSYYSLKSIECSEDLASINFRVDRKIYSESMDALMIFGNGLISITAQAYDLDAPGTCVLKVYDTEGELLSETVYPDELVL